MRDWKDLFYLKSLINRDSRSIPTSKDDRRGSVDKEIDRLERTREKERKIEDVVER